MTKKRIFIIASVLVVLIAAASAISYSIAGIGLNGDSQDAASADESASSALSSSIASDYTSNIDLIIQNSNNDDENYNIVEIIPSSATASSLSSYISSGGFKKYVIDSNSETDPQGVMADKKIKLDTINVGTSSTLQDSISSSILGQSATLQEVLDSADLIYLNSPSYTAFDGNNNMSEEVYNYLHTYALGDNKPLIINYVNSSDTGDTTTNKTFYELYNAINGNYIRGRSFPWDKDSSASQFFNRKVGNYIQYDTNQLTVTGKMLVITSNSSDASSMYQKMQVPDEKDLIDMVYYGNNKPSKLEIEVKTPAQLTAATDVQGYDFVFLEHDIIGSSGSSTAVDSKVYSALKALSDAGKYIVYDYRTSDTQTSTIDGTANNYMKLMQLLLSDSGVSRYTHVLSVKPGFFDSLVSTGADGTSGAKGIADIINNGDYRGSGSKGSNGKTYRVLEIEPCYPIDTELAESRSNGEGKQYSYGVTGNYYTDPSQVMSGVTSDEVEDGVDYYNFTLSKAKIAYATGLKMNQIEIDQMSTDEFISSKSVVLETYDLVYIGGDTSALTVGMGKFGNLSLSDCSKLYGLITNFEMYTHTGQFVPLITSSSSSAAMAKKIASTSGQQTDEYAYGTVFLNGTAQSTSVELNGNDITSLKCEELKDYVSAGMPIIIESTVANAFETSKNTLDKEGRLSQLALSDIDPDSFMYQALDYIYSSRSEKNVQWNLDCVSDKAVQTVRNENRTYGNTLGDDVTVFTQETNDLINAVITASNVRPTMTVSSSPKEYVEGNSSTYNDYNEDGCSITVSVKSSNPDSTNKFKVSLYIDVDGNGVFDDGPITGDGECAQTVSSYVYSEKQNDDGSVTPNSVTLSYSQMDKEYYGIISWKVEATEIGTGLVSSCTGYAYYKRQDGVEKKTVNILQIMPRSTDAKTTYEKAVKNNDNSAGSTFGMNDGHSLYLCTECQKYMHRATYNALLDGKEGKNCYTTYSVYQSVNMGLHEHKFGIVKYDSTTGDEDYNSNFADELAEDYEMDIDILYSDEFEEVVAQVQKSTDDMIAMYKKQMKEAQDKYQGLLDSEALKEAEAAVKDKLIEMKDSSYNKHEKFEEFAKKGQYYQFWYYNPGLNYDSDTVIKEYRTLYNNYIKLYDQVVEAKQEYKKYKRLAYAADKWLASNYDMIVLGFAEDFGGEDLNTDACQMLKDYIAKGGSMLNTHDSTTKYERAGAMNITSELRETFGMDRYHITGTAEGSGSTEAQGSTEGAAVVKVNSFEYTTEQSDYVDTVYTLEFQTNEGSVTKSFTLPKDKNTAFSYVFNFGAYNYENYKNQSDFRSVALSESLLTTSDLSNDLENFKLSIKLNMRSSAGWWYDDGDGTGYSQHMEVAYSPVTKAVSVVVYREKDGTKEQVTTGTITDGSLELEIPRGKEIIVPAKSTKEFSTSVTLKNTDRDFVVTTVDSSSSASGSYTEINTEGKKEITDTSQAMTIQLQINLPEGEGAENKYLEGNTVSITYNSRVYTRSTDSGGIVTFEIPQISGNGLTNYVTSSDVLYRKFTTKDSKLYFFTERAVTTDYLTWNKKMVSETAISDDEEVVDGNVRTQWKGFGYNSPVGLTDSYMMYNTGQNYTSPYRYVSYVYQSAVTWDMGDEKKESGSYGPNGASRVNEGIINVYPFKISTELKISTTHSQNFALDMEDTDVSVWYTLSAGTSKSKVGSSLYAASPHDGMDNYYLYSCGNVFYCGAGHSVVTGPKSDNNDERRLFINVIVNSVRNSSSAPTISLHEKDTDGKKITSDKTDGNLFIDGDSYYYTVTSKDDIPQFDFKVKVDKKADLAEVMVYYDLDYGALDEDGNANYSYAYKEGTDVLITSYNTTSGEKLKSGALAELRLEFNKDGTFKSGLENLKLKQEYFDPYGDYTYIVIKATDTNSKTTYQRLKIKLIPALFELTYQDTNKTQNCDVAMVDRKHEDI